MSNLDDLLEQEFPVADNYLYLNHAGVGPWSSRTGAAVRQFAAENVDMGARDYLTWVGVEQALRVSLARLINAPSPDDIALLKNTSEALSIVAHGFPWKTRFSWPTIPRLRVASRGSRSRYGPVQHESEASFRARAPLLLVSLSLTWARQADPF